MSKGMTRCWCIKHGDSLSWLEA